MLFDIHVFRFKYVLARSCWPDIMKCQTYMTLDMTQVVREGNTDKY